MGITDIIVATMKKTIMNTFFPNKEMFKRFLMDNNYFVIPSFEMKERSNDVDIIEIHINELKGSVRCGIKWRLSQSKVGGLVVHDVIPM